MNRIQSLPLTLPPTTSAQWVLIQRIEPDLFAGLVRLFKKGGGETRFWVGVNETEHVVIEAPTVLVADANERYKRGLMVKVKLRVDENTLRQHLLNFAGQMAVEIAKNIRPER